MNSIRRVFLLIVAIGMAVFLFLTFLTLFYLKQRQAGEGEKFCREDIPHIFIPSAFREIISECKPGMVPIPANSYSKIGCMYPLCSSYICTKCGDGVCGKGENHCNCQVDCGKSEKGDPNRNE